MALNLNVGLLGHVDSGKTSLAKSLSEIASTAAFDKNPQSQSRGITLDLGFSAFTIETPNHLQQMGIEKLQFTLVDCPGHASLIRTIIGGAQIIDMMLLVIDITKGIQTQTAECLVIAEITSKKIIIVVNKIDLIEEHKRKYVTEKMKKKIKLALSSTLFANVPIVFVSVNPNCRKIGLSELIEEMSRYSFIPDRSSEQAFLFAVDHCFGIKGQGTVMTGTVLEGSVSVNDIIDIPSLKMTKKIKSMQMFRKSILKASKGDRVGICVTQLNPNLMERGIVCMPGLANFISCAIIDLNRIKYFKHPLHTKAKYHITIGHETIMATVSIFSTESPNKFDFSDEYEYVSSLETNEETNINDNLTYFMLLLFDKPVLAVESSLIIGSKLDMDEHANACRLAFWGKLIAYSKDKGYNTTFLPKLKVYKYKTKVGMIERIPGDNTVIVKNLFKKETNYQNFIGMMVKLSTGEDGVIDSAFGQSGKMKVCFAKGLNPSTVERLLSKDKHVEPVTVLLKFKKFIYDANKILMQYYVVFMFLPALIYWNCCL